MISTKSARKGCAAIPRGWDASCRRRAPCAATSGASWLASLPPPTPSLLDPRQRSRYPWFSPEPALVLQQQSDPRRCHFVRLFHSPSWMAPPAPTLPPPPPPPPLLSSVPICGQPSYPKWTVLDFQWNMYHDIMLFKKRKKSVDLSRRGVRVSSLISWRDTIADGVTASASRRRSHRESFLLFYCSVKCL